MLSATSGGDTGAGHDAVRGAQLAIEVINNDIDLPVSLGPGAGLPRLGGAKLSLVSADTKASAEEATRQAGDMVGRQRAVGVVVADSAQVAAATASEMQRLRVPLIDAASTADFLTELGMDWYFRAGPSDRLLTEGAFALLRRHLSVTARVALIVEAGGDSATGTSAVKQAAQRASSVVVFESELREGEATDGLAEKLRQAEPEAVVAWAHTPGGAAALAGVVAEAFVGNRPVMGLGVGFRQLIQPPANGAMLLRSVIWSAELAKRTPAAQAVTQLYEKRFGHAMSGAAAEAFTSTIALAVAVDTSGTSDPAAIRSALRQASLSPTQMIMPWNGVQFAADGHNSRAAGAIEAWEGNAYRVVHPAELASRPLRWPTRTGG